jgi:glutathione S-transferase
MDTLDPQLSPYLEAWAKFRQQSQVQLAIIEQPFYSLEHGFAGTIDRSWLDGKRMVVADIKSGPLPSWLPLQLAGYSILCNAFSGMGIELRSNGSYSVKVIKTPELFKARKLFLEALVKVKKQREEKANGEKSENDGTGLDDIVSDL